MLHISILTFQMKKVQVKNVQSHLQVKLKTTTLAQTSLMSGPVWASMSGQYGKICSEVFHTDGQE